jgi:hypothetical protein
MNRKDAASLQDELMAICPQFLTPASVSIFAEKDEWSLSIIVVPHAISLDFLEKVATQHCLEVELSNKRIVFRSSPKSN